MSSPSFAPAGSDTGIFMAAAIVPAVLISACALLLLSFNNRIVAVLTRQRALHRELLEESRKSARSALANAWPSFDSCPDAVPSNGNGSLMAAAAASRAKASFADKIGTACEDDAASAFAAAAAAAQAPTEWGAALTQQVEDLRREARLIRAAVTAILLAILLFLLSGVTLAASTVSRHAGTPALVIFLMGLATFATGVLLMLVESTLIVHPLVVEEAHVRRVVSCAAARSCTTAAAGMSQSPLRVVVA